MPSACRLWRSASCSTRRLETCREQSSAATWRSARKVGIFSFRPPSSPAGAAERRAADSFRPEIDSDWRDPRNDRFLLSLTFDSLSKEDRMRAAKLDSSLIARILYDDAQATLRVCFRHGP